MADTKISALSSAGALIGTEPLPIVQGGVTVKTTVQDVANLVGTPDLQQVTTVGNTTSVGITVDNGTESVVIKHDQIKIVNASLAEAVIISPTLATTTNFEIPNKAGGTETFAMLSDITAGGDVFLANDQTFTGENTFTIGSGNDTPVTINKGGNNAALLVNKTSGSGDAIEVADGSVSIADETASTIAHFDGSKRLKSLATSTYPSLTELSYVKGVTSAIQTQINALADTIIVQCSAPTLAIVADSSNYHWGLIQVSPTGTDARRGFKFTDAGTLEKVSFDLEQVVNGSNETNTLYLRNITTATDYSIGTFLSNFGASTTYKVLYTGLSIAVNTTDDYCLKIATPAFATNPTAWTMAAILSITKS